MLRDKLSPQPGAFFHTQGYTEGKLEMFLHAKGTKGVQIRLVSSKRDTA
jgi:hypothetical protein